MTAPNLVKVTALSQTYTSQGKGYGPFTATAERPYIEVPVGIALASGAPEYDGPEAQAEGEGVITDAQASAALRADNDRLREERDALNLTLAEQRTAAERLSDLLNEAGANVTNLTVERDALKVDLDKVKAEYQDFVQASDRTGKEYQAERDALQARIIELEAIANKPALPMDALARLEAVNGISKALAQKALDALTAPAEGGEQA